MCVCLCVLCLLEWVTSVVKGGEEEAENSNKKIRLRMRFALYKRYDARKAKGNKW